MLRVQILFLLVVSAIADVQYLDITTTENITINVAVHGRGNSGQTLLLLHGFPEGQVVWDGFIRYMYQNDPTYQIIVPSLRGYNQSTIPSSISDYAIPNLLDDLNSVMEALYPTGKYWVISQ